MIFLSSWSVFVNVGMSGLRVFIIIICYEIQFTNLSLLFRELKTVKEVEVGILWVNKEVLLLFELSKWVRLILI